MEGPYTIRHRPEHEEPEDPNELSEPFKALSFVVPIAGILIYLANIKEYPKKAKTAGRLAMMGLCIGFGIWVLIYSIKEISGI